MQPQKNIYNKIEIVQSSYLKRNSDIFYVNRLQSNLFFFFYRCSLTIDGRIIFPSALENILESLLSINSDGSREIVTIHNFQ